MPETVVVAGEESLPELAPLSPKLVKDRAELAAAMNRDVAVVVLAGLKLEEAREAWKGFDPAIVVFAPSFTPSEHEIVTHDQRARLRFAVERELRLKRLEKNRTPTTKSGTLGNFSEEIRTPLDGIINYCDLLIREEGSRLTPHGRRDLQVVKTNARTLLALVNDILDLSKIEAGQVEVMRDPVDLVALVEECAAAARETLRGKDVEVYATVAPDVSTVQSDAPKLRQILLHLLTNASKLTEAGEINVEAKLDGTKLVLKVEDTGAGIAAEHLPFVFEKFRRGTGLGLPIARELCHVLGGKISAKSTVGRGSVFTATLPMSATSPEGPSLSQPQPSTKREQPTGATVLVVDDDPLVHQLLKKELEREGMRVLHAANAGEAMTIARQYRPSTVVVDLHVANADGWKTLTELKADPLLAGIPVLTIAVDEARARGFALGGCEYLIRPFEPARLTQVVSKVSGDIYVVDDDALATELRQAGFTTTTVANRPAMVVTTPRRFDVIPGLRAANGEVPIVVVTGKDPSEEEQSGLRTGLASLLRTDGGNLVAVVADAKRMLLEQRRTASGKLPRVLYVEDSAQNRDVVRRYLEGVFEVTEAEDGEQGIERAERERPDLVLMDLSLPRVDGWEATRRLKAGSLAKTPIIALTAHAGREDQARAKAAGCDGYLTKPVERDLLISTIKQHLKPR